MNWLLPIALAFSGAVQVVCAQSSVDKGLDVATEYDRRDFGYGDYTANMEMVLTDTHGNDSIRQLHTKTIEVEKEGESERRLLVFDHPQDVRGTVLLTWSQKERHDDQWLYFPAIKRVKRIASKNRSGPFMGSEFSYEDFSAPEVRKYTYQYLREETCGNEICHVLERYPVDGDSGYSRQILWIDKKEYRLWQVHYYDRKDKLLKTLTISGYQRYLDRYWRAGLMEMENVQNGKKTVLRWSDYRFAEGLRMIDFQPARLEKVR